MRAPQVRLAVAQEIDEAHDDERVQRNERGEQLHRQPAAQRRRGESGDGESIACQLRDQRSHAIARPSNNTRRPCTTTFIGIMTSSRIDSGGIGRQSARRSAYSAPETPTVDATTPSFSRM